MWDVEATGAFEEWWLTLTAQEQDDVTALVELLGERGPRLPFPYSSGIENSKFPHMRELRIQSHGDPIRVFYAFDPQRVAAEADRGDQERQGKAVLQGVCPEGGQAL
jgi:hypothetical protein